MAAGPTEISTILSQSGRIEKINQNPFVQSEVARQVLTEEEAKARLHRNKEVVESKKVQEVSGREKTREERRRGKSKDKNARDQGVSEEEDKPQGEKHIIDVVV